MGNEEALQIIAIAGYEADMEAEIRSAFVGRENEARSRAEELELSLVTEEQECETLRLWMSQQSASVAHEKVKAAEKRLEAERVVLAGNTTLLQQREDLLLHEKDCSEAI